MRYVCVGGFQKTILSLAWPRYTGVSMEMEMERGRGEGREVRAESQQNIRDRKSRVLGRYQMMMMRKLRALVNQTQLMPLTVTIH